MGIIDVEVNFEKECRDKESKVLTWLRHTEARWERSVVTLNSLWAPSEVEGAATFGIGVTTPPPYREHKLDFAHGNHRR